MIEVLLPSTGAFVCCLVTLIWLYQQHLESQRSIFEIRMELERLKDHVAQQGRFLASLDQRLTELEVPTGPFNVTIHQNPPRDGRKNRDERRAEIDAAQQGWAEEEPRAPWTEKT